MICKVVAKRHGADEDGIENIGVYLGGKRQYRGRMKRQLEGMGMYLTMQRAGEYAIVNTESVYG